MIAIGVIILLFVCTRLIPEKKLSVKYAGYDLSTSQGAVSAEKTYSEYQAEHKNAANPSITIPIDIWQLNKTACIAIEKIILLP